MDELNDLQERLKDVVISTCNTVGCANCGLQWDGGCSASDLQDRILDIEMGENNVV